MTKTIDAEQLRILVDDICESDALGRSKVYAKLLRYLAEASIVERLPKEIEIAMDVLGRDGDFDVTKDSAVRVYIHQLRKRLDAYYEKQADNNTLRITIPKGQYNIELGYDSDTSSSNFLSDSRPSKNVSTDKKLRINSIFLIAIAILLLGNIFYLFVRDAGLISEKNKNEAVITHPFWKLILTDDVPIMVVVGDYYIFGELDKAGNIKRMIREFSVNSRADLESLFVENPELAWRYNDLDLSYIPEGAAFAMNRILPIAHSAQKPVSMKMMSELTIQDLQTYHIVYLGYISGLDRLAKMIFTASGLKIGENYDELIDKKTGKRFVSDAGLPSENRPFVGYGFISSIPTTQNNRLVVISGMRDAGLAKVADLLTNKNALDQIDDSIFESNENKSAFELLFEVRGMDRMSFSSRPVFEGTIDSNRIWRAEDLQ